MGCQGSKSANTLKSSQPEVASSEPANLTLLSNVSNGTMKSSPLVAATPEPANAALLSGVSDGTTRTESAKGKGKSKGKGKGQGKGKGESKGKAKGKGKGNGDHLMAGHEHLVSVYNVGTHVEVFSASQDKWLQGRIEENENRMLGIAYEGPGGTASVKQLPVGHEHVRPLYLAGGKVEVFSASQQKWVIASVQQVENGLLTVAYEVPGGQTMKQLPATHEHLRPAQTIESDASADVPSMEQVSPEPSPVADAEADPMADAPVVEDGIDIPEDKGTPPAGPAPTKGGPQVMPTCWGMCAAEEAAGELATEQAD